MPRTRMMRQTVKARDRSQFPTTETKTVILQEKGRIASIVSPSPNAHNKRVEGRLVMSVSIMIRNLNASVVKARRSGLVKPRIAMWLKTAIRKATRAAATIKIKCANLERITVTTTVLVVAVVLIMTSCQRKPVMAHARFMHLPAQGWQQSCPLTFTPEYDDSAATYNLILAIRHNNSYRYRNLSLAVDIIAVDSVVDRRMVNMQLADEYGNRVGGGFGTLYQDTVLLCGVIDPSEARSVVVWQAMHECDTLTGLTDIGLIVNPI